MGDKTKGLYDKFRVSRVDGSDAPGGKHHGCRYYVLDIDHDRFAIAAINAYARACKPHYPFLADDLESLVGIEDDPRDRRIAELEAENERLRAALEPFARWASQMDSPPNWVPDGCPIIASPGDISDFCVGMLRRARAALAGEEQENG